MLQPELWAKHCCDYTTLSNKRNIEKYKHLLTWRDNESILELGIGDGTNSKVALLPHLPKNFKEFIGSDISTPMIEHAEKTLKLERMEFMKFDFSQAVIPHEFRNRFDHIFSFIVIHWIRNLKQAFSNIYKMLKPGGEMFFTFFERSSADEVYDYLSKHPKWGKYGHEQLISPFHFYENPRKEYERVLRESGFTDYHFAVENWSYAFPSEQAFEETFYSINPIIQKLSSKDADEYKKLYIEKMKRNNLNWVTICKETGEEVFNSKLKMFIVFAKKKPLNSTL